MVALGVMTAPSILQDIIPGWAHGVLEVHSHHCRHSCRDWCSHGGQMDMSDAWSPSQSEGRIGTCQDLTGSPSDLQPLWWLLFCGLILLLNTKLMSMSVQTLMAMTLSSLAIVVTYFLFS